MNNFFTKDELLELGFSSVGENVVVSKDARFYVISGSLGNNVRIDDFAILTGEIYLHDNVHISPFCFLGGTGGKIEMHNNSGVAAHVCVYTISTDYTSSVLSNNIKTKGDVTIDENSVIGAGVVIMPNVHIYKNVSIGCNCVVTKDIEEGQIIVNRAMGLLNVANR